MSAGRPSANASRFSAKSSASATPCARPTATASRIRSSMNARACGFPRMGPIGLRMVVVAPDSPTRKTYFSQIDLRMSALSSASTPARTSARCRNSARAELRPSYSPSTMRCMVPVWRMTPGRETCVAT